MVMYYICHLNYRKYFTIKIRALKLKVKKDKKYSVCSCGLSKILPYCDNRHRAYNKEHNTTYKSIKVILRGDNSIDVKCSNWEK